MAARQNNSYFLPANGIARQVITADVCRYLGNDALVKPGNDDQGQPGFLITAYRALTTDMIADLKADSSRWKAEKEQAPSSSKRSKEPETYISSRTHEHRQIYGPSFPETPQTRYVQPQQQPYDEPSGRNQSGADMSQQQPYDESSGRIQSIADRSQQQAYDSYYNQQNSANQHSQYNQHVPSYQPVSGGTPSSGYPGGTAYPDTDTHPSNQYEFNSPTYYAEQAGREETQSRIPNHPGYPPQAGREETQPRIPNHPGYPPQAGRSGQPYYDPRTGQPVAYPGQAPTQNNAPRYNPRHPERGTDPYDRNDGYTWRGR